MHRPVLVTPPSAAPVSLIEAKAHLRVDHDEDDDSINLLIGAAVGHLDGWTGILGRCLATQTWRQDYSCFAPVLRLPLEPAASITSITDDGEPVASESYSLATDAGGSVVRFAEGVSLTGAISVTFVAGYEDVPAPIKAAILLMVGHWYQNREAVAVGVTVENLPMAVDALLAPYRRVGV